jgi:hypothetical protein
LGSSMTAAGGIGIAKMISKQLHKAADTPRVQERDQLQGVLPPINRSS